MVMEMGCAKLLDEACNRNNEVYRDELLYAQWLNAPCADVPAVAPVDRVDSLRAGLDGRRQ